MDTIFNTKSLERSLVKWEDYLDILTPVEKIGEYWFKREDKFAPLGYGNINGTKLRQLIWLINKYVKNNEDLGNKLGIISGAISGSPQHPMVGAVAKHYKIPSINFVGTKNIEKSKNLFLAKNFGVEFYFSKIAYAKNLEIKSFQLKKNLYNDYFVLETNITVKEKINTEEMIENFHLVSSSQIKNLPENIENLFIPCGSCNSVVSILYGIAQFKPKNLKNIILFGIGSYGSKEPSYIIKRLSIIEKIYGKNINNLFNYDFVNEKENNKESTYNVKYYNLNGIGFCKYSDLMNYEYNGIIFHPRYEGKIFKYIEINKNIFLPYLNKNTCFWIIGSECTGE